MHGIRFYRTARDYSGSFSYLPRDEIVIPAPTVLSPGQGGVGSWLLIFVPLVASLGTAAYAFVYHFSPILTLIIVGIALLTSVVGIFARLQQQYAQKKREKADRNAYLDYLAKLRAELSKTAHLQRQAYARLSPTPSRLLDVVRFRNQEQTQLWERRAADQDFLQVRIGVGVTPFCRSVRLDVNSNPFVQYRPELLAESEKLLASFKQLDDAPVQIDLKTLGTLALVGNSNVTRGLMRSILCQLVAFHSPEDVRIAAYFPSQVVQEWEWLKWLPHTRRLQQVKKQQATESLCLLADNIAELQELLSFQITPELERRQQLNEQETVHGAMLPHLIIILDGYAPDGEIARLPEIQKLFQDKRNNGIDPLHYGVTVICLVNSIRQEPSAIRARITISESRELVLQEIAEGASRRDNITTDTAEVTLCEQIGRYLAPLMLVEKGTQQDLSQDVRLLDLLAIPSADAVQISETWKPRAQQDILRVPIGRRADGTPLLLDLKEASEKGMGPHGLVIGATGSGKSELLRTLITGLAITHNPQTVNFVLVDFKGGPHSRIMPHCPT
jgi:DNA segregation ATPase FtsK/SpoIIIE, S-DNA-T family